MQHLCLLQFPLGNHHRSHLKAPTLLAANVVVDGDVPVREREVSRPRLLLKLIADLQARPI